MNQLLVVLIVWGVFFLSSKLLPPGNKPLLESYNVAEIRKKYAKVEWYSNILLLLITVLLIILFSNGFAWLQRILLESQESGSRYLIPISIAAFVVPSIFLGIFTSGVIGEYVLLLFQKIQKFNQDEWDVFVYDMNKRQAFGNVIDNHKLSVIVMSVLVPLSLVMIFLALNTYTIITDNYLIDNTYLRLQEVKYPYTQVAKILYITKYQNRQSREIEDTTPHYSVVMKDGYVWSTVNASVHDTPTEVDIVNFISQKTGIQIQNGIHNIDD